MTQPTLDTETNNLRGRAKADTDKTQQQLPANHEPEPEPSIKEDKKPKKYLSDQRDGKNGQIDMVQGQKAVQAATITGPRAAAFHGSRHLAQCGSSQPCLRRRAPWSHLP